jgi:hypothetical protein
MAVGLRIVAGLQQLGVPLFFLQQLGADLLALELMLIAGFQFAIDQR